MDAITRERLIALVTEPKRLDWGDVGREIDTYDPLSPEQVNFLIDCAIDEITSGRPNGGLTSKIQCRLSRAIPGSTCPRKLWTPTMRMNSKADHLYVELLKAQDVINANRAELVQMLGNPLAGKATAA